MSEYKKYTPDQVDNLLSNFLISSWSYSKVAQFARHEKAFEMRYIYNLKGKNSASSVAGSAYHEALDRFFTGIKTDNRLDLASLEIIAFEYIDEFPAPFWKIQKTTPTIEECKAKALKTVNALLKNFFGDIGTYIDEIKEVIDVEVYCDEWLTINGVDIPMPCHLKIDLVFQSIHDKLIIVDHKSKTSFTDEQEAKLSIGEQAITYVKGYESKSGLDIDEIWFIENKIAQNKDGSNQLLPIKIKVDKDTRRLYEALLYEPLKRMLAAVQDPDYIYLINQSDNYEDKSDIYEFWAKTMIAEVEDFPIEESKREMVSKRLKRIRDISVGLINPKVIRDFQKNASQFIQYDLSNKDMTPEQKIEHVLRSFNIIVNVAYKFDGYSSNTYLLEVSAGVKITSVHSHRLDIANALDVAAVRISKDLVVHNGKSYVSIEFSKKRERTLLFDPAELVDMKIPLGKDNYENTIYWDLDNHSTTNALVCGSIGSGKSVLVRNSIEYGKQAGIEDIYIIDPKFEFGEYENDYNANIRVVSDILEIEETVAMLVDKMNENIRNGVKRKVLVFLDEFADAIAASRKGVELDIREEVQVGNYAPKKGMFGMMMEGAPKMQMKKTGELKSLEQNIQILLQKGRSSGFRIMAATQRASVKIINGDTKVNFPVQICFRVPKEADSRVVLDEAGAETLAGMGDGLIKSPEYNETTRFQAFYKPVEVTV